MSKPHALQSHLNLDRSVTCPSEVLCRCPISTFRRPVVQLLLSGQPSRWLEAASPGPKPHRTENDTSLIS